MGKIGISSERLQLVESFMQKYFDCDYIQGDDEEEIITEDDLVMFTLSYIEKHSRSPKATTKMSLRPYFIA